MLAAIALYLVALSAMTFAGLSAVTLIYSVSPFDPPGVDAPIERTGQPTASAAVEHSHDPVAA